MDASRLSGRGGRGASFNRTLLSILSSVYKKNASVSQMKHLVNPGGRWETGPTFHFGSSANPSGSVVTGCGFLFTVIPSLCWRHWTREGGSPADMRGVTKLKGQRRTRGRRVTGSWCGQGVGADVKFTNGQKTCDSQQSLFPCDLRMKQQSNPRLQEGVSHNVFCTPCCQINWGPEALEVANGLQKVAGPPPSYTSRVTRCKFTAEELQRDQPKLEDAAPVRVSSHVHQGFSPQKLEGDEKGWIVLTGYKIKQQWRIYHIPILLGKT